MIDDILKANLKELGSQTPERIIRQAILNPQAKDQRDTMAYYAYIMTNSRTTTLYIGATSDLERRVFEHKKKFVDGFTKKYNLDRLYYEETDDVLSALEREKQLKGWLRRRKAALVETMNPQWSDLSAKWYE